MTLDSGSATPKTAPRATALLLDVVGRLPPGHIVMPVTICPIVPWAVRMAGHDLVFADIDAASWDLRTVQPDVAPQAIVYVRPYGATLERRALFADWRRRWPTAVLIDDACLAVPETRHDDDGEDADIVLFSTGHGKPVGLGGGGFAWLSARAERVFDQPSRLSSPGPFDTHTTRYSPDGEIRERVDLAVAPPDWLEYRAHIERRAVRAAAHRSALNAIYRDAFPASVTVPPGYDTWRFHLRVDAPEAALATLARAGLFASRHYRPLSPNRETFPHAWAWHDQMINLFIDDAATVPMAIRTAELLQPHVSAGRARPAG